jgi:hypothetical protein
MKLRNASIYLRNRVLTKHLYALVLKYGADIVERKIAERFI